MIGMIIDSRPIEENNDKKNIKYIQEDFHKLYVKIKDQVERIDIYLNELISSNEFDLLAKKLQSIGVSFHKLKSIDKQREQKMVDKKVFSIAQILGTRRVIQRRNNDSKNSK